MVVRRWVQERNPGGVSEAGVGCEVDGGVVVEGGDGSPAVVEVLCVPGSDGGVGESVVEDGVELGGSGDVVGERVADDLVGEAVPAAVLVVSFSPILLPWGGGFPYIGLLSSQNQAVSVSYSVRSVEALPPW